MAGRQNSHELPPAANWYSSSACDWCATRTSSLVAYATKNEVRLLDPEGVWMRGALIGHSDRVTSLELFHPAQLAARGGDGGECGMLCVTGSADACVRVWDCDSLACLHSLCGHHEQEVAGVSHCRDARATSVSADRAGTIVIWDYTTSQVAKISPLKAPATCVKCGMGGVVAVGFQNGVVVVLDVARHTVLHRLIGHEGEVNGLDWAPPLFKPTDASTSSKVTADCWENSESGGADACESASVDVLVSSSGRDKSIRLWSLRLGSQTNLLTLPKGKNSNSSGGSNGGDGGNGQRQWLACRFLPACGGSGGNGALRLVSTGLNGDLWLWTLTRTSPHPSSNSNPAKGNRKSGREKVEVVAITGSVASGGRLRASSHCSSTPHSHSRSVFALCFGPPSFVRDAALGWGGKGGGISGGTGVGMAVGNGSGSRQARLDGSDASPEASLHRSPPAFTLPMFTISMDRHLGVWRLDVGCGSVGCGSVVMVPTLGGYPYHLDVCPHHPRVLAVALGDHSIRIWHTDTPEQPYKGRVLWRGLATKVVVVRWHPSEEGVVAFGLDDGRVGIYHILSDKHRILPGKHKGNIYQLVWCVEGGEGECGATASATASASAPAHLHPLLLSCGKDGAMLARPLPPQGNARGHGGGSMEEDSEGQEQHGQGPAHAQTAAINVSAIIEEVGEVTGGGVRRGDGDKVCEFELSGDGKLLAMGMLSGHVHFYCLPHGLAGLLRQHVHRNGGGGQTTRRKSGSVGVSAQGTGAQGAPQGREEGRGAAEEGGGAGCCEEAVEAQLACDEEVVWMCSGTGQKMLINRLSWHPHAHVLCHAHGHDGHGSCDAGGSGSVDWGWGTCASACDDGDILVYSLETRQLSDASARGEVMRRSSEVLLRGHTKGVAGLDWCPSKSTWLASASFDFTAQVWDARSGVGLYSLRGHCGRVFCVRWALEPAALANTRGHGRDGEYSGSEEVGGVGSEDSEDVWGVYTASDDQSVRWWQVERDGVAGGPPKRANLHPSVAAVMKLRSNKGKGNNTSAAARCSPAPSSSSSSNPSTTSPLLTVVASDSEGKEHNAMRGGVEGRDMAPEQRDMAPLEAGGRAGEDVDGGGAVAEKGGGSAWSGFGGRFEASQGMRGAAIASTVASTSHGQLDSRGMNGVGGCGGLGGGSRGGSGVGSGGADMLRGLDMSRADKKERTSLFQTLMHLPQQDTVHASKIKAEEEEEASRRAWGQSLVERLLRGSEGAAWHGGEGAPWRSATTSDNKHQCEKKQETEPSNKHHTHASTSQTQPSACALEAEAAQASGWGSGRQEGSCLAPHIFFPGVCLSKNDAGEWASEEGRGVQGSEEGRGGEAGEVGHGLPARRPLPRTQPPTLKTAASEVGGWLGGSFDAEVSDGELIAALQRLARHFVEKSQWDRGATVSLMTGDLAAVLCRAGEQGSLTASLVAASPMLGLDAWTAASRLFARQLQAAGFYHQAVTHLLACHQVIEAISVYRKAGLWRDALAVARARLAHNDAVVLDLWLSWGRALQMRAQGAVSRVSPVTTVEMTTVEMTAACFLKAGKPELAVHALLSRFTSPSAWPLSTSCLRVLRAGLALARAYGVDVGRGYGVGAGSTRGREYAVSPECSLTLRTAASLLLQGANAEAIYELLDGGTVCVSDVLGGSGLRVALIFIAGAAHHLKRLTRAALKRTSAAPFHERARRLLGEEGSGPRPRASSDLTLAASDLTLLISEESPRQSRTTVLNPQHAHASARVRADAADGGDEGEGGDGFEGDARGEGDARTTSSCCPSKGSRAFDRQVCGTQAGNSAFVLTREGDKEEAEEEEVVYEWSNRSEDMCFWLSLLGAHKELLHASVPPPRPLQTADGGATRNDRLAADGGATRSGRQPITNPTPPHASDAGGLAESWHGAALPESALSLQSLDLVGALLEADGGTGTAECKHLLPVAVALLKCAVKVVVGGSGGDDGRVSGDDGGVSGGDSLREEATTSGGDYVRDALALLQKVPQQRQQPREQLAPSGQALGEAPAVERDDERRTRLVQRDDDDRRTPLLPGLTSYLLQLHATCNATTCGECARHTARPGGDCGGEDEWARDRLHRDILHRDLAGLQTWEGSGGVSSHQAVTCMTRHGSGGESKHSWSALPSVITWLSPTP